jgi:hypothetical protein
MEREALKLALEALESGVKTTAEQISWIEYVMNDAITAIKEALAQPAQEPVGMTIIGKLGNTYLFTGAGDYSPRKGDKVYTAPPKRPWVELTDEEIIQIINSNNSTGLWSMAIEIGAKLRSKNT